MASICAASSTVSGMSVNSISSASVVNVTPKSCVSQIVRISGCAVEKVRSASPESPQAVSVTLFASGRSTSAAPISERLSSVSGVPVKSSAKASETKVLPASVTSQTKLTEGNSSFSASWLSRENALPVSVSVLSSGRRTRAARSSSSEASGTIMFSLSPSKLSPASGTVQNTRTSGSAARSARMAEISLHALTSALARFSSLAKAGISPAVKSAVTMFSLSPSNVLPPMAMSQRMCASGSFLRAFVSCLAVIFFPRRSIVSARRETSFPLTSV